MATGGPAYIRMLRGPFPFILLILTGSADERNVGDFLKSGAFAVGAGGALFDKVRLEAKDWAGMTAGKWPIDLRRAPARARLVWLAQTSQQGGERRRRAGRE